MEAATFDASIRHHVYDITCRTGAPPRISTLAAVTNAPADAVEAALVRLAVQRVIVLQPASGEILMAPPFSAVPTPFLVRTRHDAYANCAWDALGVSVMLRQPARVESACACCGEALLLATDMHAGPSGHAVIHFAVPALRWWEDIVFT